MKTEQEIEERAKAYDQLVTSWAMGEVGSLHDAMVEMGVTKAPESDDECMLILISCYRTLQWVVK